MTDDIARGRRERLHWLLQHRFDGSKAALARAVGRPDDYVWQLLADPEHKASARNIGERMARTIEAALRLPRGWLDLPGPPREPEPAAWRYATPELATRLAAGEPPRGIPVVGTAQLGEHGYYDELAYPPGHGDGYVDYPTRDGNAYALRVRGDSMRPRIKPGEFVIVEPNTPAAAGDEVLVRTRDGRVMVKVLGFRRDGLVELRSVNDAHPPMTLDEAQIELLHHVAGFGKVALFRRE